MISFYNFHSRNKRGMLVIAPEVSDNTIVRYLKPLQKEKLPVGITFNVVAGKKMYDIIGLHHSWIVFFSQKIIDILSQFIDMSDKCYPIVISGIEEQYYVIHNLQAYYLLNKEKQLFIDSPRYYKVYPPYLPIFGIDATGTIVVSEEVKDALLKNKASNIEFVECFGCTLEEYEEIKKNKSRTKVNVYRDK